MFIRIKNIKNGEYAYLVENSWKKKTSRQEVKEYLGKVVRLERRERLFTNDLTTMSFGEAVKTLIEFELHRLGLVDVGGAFEDGDYHYDTTTHEITVKRTGKRVVIKSHEGYLCKHTIETLLAFNPIGTEEEIGMDLARALVGCGLIVDKGHFVQLFEKVFDLKKSMHR